MWAKLGQEIKAALLWIINAQWAVVSVCARDFYLSDQKSSLVTSCKCFSIRHGVIQPGNRNTIAPPNLARLTMVLYLYGRSFSQLTHFRPLLYRDCSRLLLRLLGWWCYEKIRRSLQWSPLVKNYRLATDVFVVLELFNRRERVSRISVGPVGLPRLCLSIMRNILARKPERNEHENCRSWVESKCRNAIPETPGWNDMRKILTIFQITYTLLSKRRQNMTILQENSSVVLKNLKGRRWEQEAGL